MSDENLSIFDGRKPAFSFGKARGFRSRPGAPQANTARNLPLSQPSGTPQSVWDKWFPGASTAKASPGIAPDDTFARMPDGTAGPVGGGGITERTLDSAFGAGHWSRILGREPVARPADPLYTAAPFMPQSPSTPFTVPKPLTGPLGNKASDRANLATNTAMYEPGGMSGLWGSRAGAKRPAEQWERPTLEQAAAISWRYQPRRA